MFDILSQWLQSALDFFLNRPLLLLICLAGPFFLAARWRQAYPTRRMLVLAAVPLLMSVLMLLVPMILFFYDPSTATSFGQRVYRVIGWWVLVVDLIFFGLVIVDFGLLLVWGRKLSITRQIPRVVSLGKPFHAEIELTNSENRNLRVSLKDDLGDSFDVDPLEFDLRIGGKSRTRFHYQSIPKKRGRFELEGVYLRRYSPLQLWQTQRLIECEATVSVYPDMQQISEFDLLAKRNRLSLMGLRRTRKIGQDNEFERLRDYTQDDNYKFIDWRTTARRRKLTVRDYQANQSQHVVFMIDCGRMMTGTENDISLLDYSLNAMLMLAYVALKQGDSVGMITFSNRVHNFTPIRSGVQHINRLLHACFNQKPEFVESRYDEAFVYLRSHFRKRALVVLITNVIDEINAHQIRQYLCSLTGQHLPLGVFLRDREIFSVVDTVDFEDDPSVYRAAAAVDILGWRQQVIRDLKHHGVLALDVFSDQLTAAVVNQYLEVKARHLL